MEWIWWYFIFNLPGFILGLISLGIIISRYKKRISDYENDPFPKKYKFIIPITSLIFWFLFLVLVFRWTGFNLACGANFEEWKFWVLAVAIIILIFPIQIILYGLLINKKNESE